ncbi:MAG: ABC transporter permease [Clostridia bacterium]|jgi:ABC-2 type transport system permease protein|nr:ABC transporter permease [Clostridiaceae bacterium]
MFAHIFKYRMKCLLKDKETMFWTLLFPLALGIFFNLAFSGIGKGETFQTIPVAVVDNEEYRNDTVFQTILQEVSSGEDPLFHLHVVSEQVASKMLEDNQISGYFVAGSPVTMVVKTTGMRQSIIRSFLDTYIQNMSLVSTVMQKNPKALKALTDDLFHTVSYLKEVSATDAKPDNVASYYYVLIAMACFYGGFQGSRDISDIQANNTDTAARLNLTPVSKMKTFLVYMSASLLIHYIKMLLLLSFLVFVIKVNFGGKVGFILLTTLLGSIAGLSFGAFVSALLKKSEGIKIAVIVGTSMLMSFLAGMMYQGMKYIIQRNVPVLSYLNPLNLLTDAYYSLYYYDTYTRYAVNMGCLALFIPVFCIGTYLIVRRRKYASL